MIEKLSRDYDTSTEEYLQETVKKLNSVIDSLNTLTKTDEEREARQFSLWKEAILRQYPCGGHGGKQIVIDPNPKQ